MRRLPTVLLLCCALLARCTSLAPLEQVSPIWKVLGVLEDPAHAVTFVVAQEVGVPKPRLIVTLHELIAVGVGPAGQTVRAYREEPCVVVIDHNRDGTLTPKDRRYKLPNVHGCPLTALPATYRVRLTATTVALEVRVPVAKAKAEVSALRAAHRPRIAVQHQLPGID